MAVLYASDELLHKFINSWLDLVDNVQLRTDVLGISFSIQPLNKKACSFALEHCYGDYFNCYFDEFRFYDIGLSEANIFNLCKAFETVDLEVFDYKIWGITVRSSVKIKFNDGYLYDTEIKSIFLGFLSVLQKVPRSYSPYN